MESETWQDGMILEQIRDGRDLTLCLDLNGTSWEGKNEAEPIVTISLIGCENLSEFEQYFAQERYLYFSLTQTELHFEGYAESIITLRCAATRKEVRAYTHDDWERRYLRLQREVKIAEDAWEKSEQQWRDLEAHLRRELDRCTRKLILLTSEDSPVNARQRTEWTLEKEVLERTLQVILRR